MDFEVYFKPFLAKKSLNKSEVFLIKSTPYSLVNLTLVDSKPSKTLKEF